MSLQTDMTGFLLGVLESPSATMTAANVSTSSAMGMFDPILSAGIEDATAGLSQSTTEAVLNFTTTEAAMNPFMASTYDKLKCGHFTVVDKKLHFTVDVAEACRFWSEGIFSSVVAAFGLMGNLVSIWVLSVPEMRNSFNRLLLALAIIDCMFIVPGILIYTRKAFEWNSDWYNRAFPIFLYPFSEIALCSSVYMTVAIAVERYIGLCRPLQRLSGRPCSAKVYIIPVVVIALLLNVTKFLESETVSTSAGALALGREGSGRYRGATRVQVTDLRVHPDYITYYQMWTRLIATGVLPLLLLALLNTKIYLSIRQSKQQLRILAIRSALPMATILSKAAPPPPPPVSSQTTVAQLALPGGGSGAASSSSSSSLDMAEEGELSPPAAMASSSSSSNGKARNARLLLLQRSASYAIDEGDEADQVTNNATNGVSSSSSPRSSLFRSKRGNSTAAAENNNGRMALLGNGHASKPAITRSASAFDSPSPTRAKARRAALLQKGNRSASARDACRLGPKKEDSKKRNGNGVDASAPIVQGSQVTWQSTNNSSSGADMKLAPILFGVVIVFVLCNSLRVILNIYDFSVLESIIQCEKKGVSRLPPSWILCSISVSHLLLMVNSSVNFLVYCVAGTRFRRVLVRKVRACVSKITGFCRPKPDPLAEMLANEELQNNGAGHPCKQHRMLMLSSRQNTATSMLAPSTFGNSIRRHNVVQMEGLEEEEEELEGAALIQEDERTEIVIRPGSETRF